MSDDLEELERIMLDADRAESKSRHDLDEQLNWYRSAVRYASAMRSNYYRACADSKKSPARVGVTP